MHKKIRVLATTIVLLSSAGLLISFYLLFRFYSHEVSSNLPSETFCDVNAYINCSKVESSPWSSFLGQPLGFWGVIYFSGLIALYFILTLSFYSLALVVVSIIGVITSVVLLYVSIYKIQALCIFCTLVYLITLLLACLSFYLNKLIRKNTNSSEKNSSYMQKPNKVYLATSCWILTTLFTVLLAPPLFQRLARISQANLAKPLSLYSDVYAEAEEQKVLTGWKEAKISNVPLNVTSNDLVLGAKENPIVQIVEFSDFECPACQRSFQEVQELLTEYPEKVQFVLKNFPLDKSCNPLIQSEMHRYSCEAAKTAHCFGLEGYFKEALTTLFRSSIYPPPGSKLRESLFDLVASEIDDDKIDSNKITKCIKSEVPVKKIEEDVKLGKLINLEYTPTIFINNKKLEESNNLNLLVKALIADESKE
jgi:uncharacterized membrane protein/protein-disulfide isomerase